MAERKNWRARGTPPARSDFVTPEEPAGGDTGAESSAEKDIREETKVMPSYGTRTQTQIEGVTVIGEAVRRTPSESAEIIVEVTSAAPSAAQALRDNQTKTMQVTQAVSPAGVQHGDIQSIGMKLQNMYSPAMPSLPGYGLPLIGQGMIGQGMMAQGGLSPYSGAGAMQPEVQFGSYFATNTLRINIREPARAGEVADLAARAGAAPIGGVRFRPADEAGARKSALEAAAKDARLKADALAAASGKQVGDPVAITEDIVASNGTFMALRATAPFAFGAGAPETVGELEYYARVSANFKLV